MAEINLFEFKNTKRITWQKKAVQAMRDSLLAQFLNFNKFTLLTINNIPINIKEKIDEKTCTDIKSKGAIIILLNISLKKYINPISKTIALIPQRILKKVKIPIPIDLFSFILSSYINKPQIYRMVMNVNLL